MASAIKIMLIDEVAILGVFHHQRALSGWVCCVHDLSGEMGV